MRSTNALALGWKRPTINPVNGGDTLRRWIIRNADLLLGSDPQYESRLSTSPRVSNFDNVVSETAIIDHIICMTRSASSAGCTDAGFLSSVDVNKAKPPALAYSERLGCYSMMRDDVRNIP